MAKAASPLVVEKIPNPYQWLVGKDGLSLMRLLKTNKVQDARGLLSTSLSVMAKRVNGDLSRVVVEACTPSEVVLMERNKPVTTDPIRTR